jgi:predicted phage terminase large subunit-like protein
MNDAPHSTDALLRGACIDSLTTFAETMQTGYRAAALHRLLAGKLEDCFHRKVRRLCISCPPRHGKSRLTSVMLPAWALTRDPRMEVVVAAYSAELAETFSLECRRVLESETYRALFPPILSADSVNRARWWTTTGGGGFVACGVDGGLTGRGADILIVDDPIRNRAEANSETYRDRVWDWFVSTALTRLSPSGVCIVTATRWHEGDLVGRLTNPERTAKFAELGLADHAFESLSLEAICETPEEDPLFRVFDQALWPERYPLSRLEAVRLEIGEREFASLYQGRPSALGGNLCDVSKIKFIDRAEVPRDLRPARAWDLALGTHARSDFSCGALGGLHRASGNFFLLAMDRGKRTWLEQKQRIAELAQQDGTPRIAIEAVAAWSGLADELRQTLAGRTLVKTFTPTSSKDVRAAGWMSLVDAGKFFVVRGPWNDEFVRELTVFPNGAHDDQVDAVSLLWEDAQSYRPILLA